MKRGLQSRGSIMIWTLFMGITLATVFFFFSQRLNLGVASQRMTMEYLNAELLVNSYADYLQGLGKAQLETLRGDLAFEGMTGTLTNETEEITGMLDLEAEISYEVADGDAKIEWNRCDEKGILEVSPAPASPPSLENCPSLTYDGLSQSNGSPFTLKALGEPFSYRIKPLANAKLYDNEWQLTLETPVRFRKKIGIHRAFTPTAP